MVSRTGSVAWRGDSCFAVILNLLKMQVGQIFDAGVEGIGGVPVFKFEIPFCEH